MADHVTIGGADTTEYKIVGGTPQDTFTFSFEFFDNAGADIEIYDGASSTPLSDSTYTILPNTGTEGGYVGGTITLDTPVSNTTLTVSLNLEYTRNQDFPLVGNFNIKSLNTVLDRLTLLAKQLQNRLNRAFKLPVTDTTNADLTMPTPEANKIIGIWDNAGTSILIGPTADEVSNAQTYSIAAQTAQTLAEAAQAAAETAQTGAETAETGALAAQTAAEAAVSSMKWDVKYISTADSPYTVTDADNGKMLVVDCTSGAVTINLEQIANLTLASRWQMGVKKSDSSGNGITINRGGTDTINVTETSLFVSVQNSGHILIADIDATPDDWTSSQFGPIGGNMTVDTLADGVDYTAGSSTTLTLSGSPGSENNVDIGFYTSAGAMSMQSHDSYSLSSNTITFASAIPADVAFVEVKFGTPLGINVPADGTVNTSKIADNAVSTAKIADDAVTADKILNPGTLGSVQVYTASGIWNKPAGMVRAEIEIVAPGGGGGYGRLNDGAMGGGGGGGEYRYGIFEAATLGSTETITIGTPGTGGTAGGTAATAGGNSTFGSHLQANGGGAGGGSTTSTAAIQGGPGGSGGSGGDYSIDGQDGHTGTGGVSDGNGGSSHLGLGGVAYTDGNVGKGYGAGGSGGRRTGGTNRAGADGTGGIIIVKEYF